MDASDIKREYGPKPIPKEEFIEQNGYDPTVNRKGLTFFEFYYMYDFSPEFQPVSLTPFTIIEG